MFVSLILVIWEHFSVKYINFHPFSNHLSHLLGLLPILILVKFCLLIKKLLSESTTKWAQQSLKASYMTIIYQLWIKLGISFSFLVAGPVSKTQSTRAQFSSHCFYPYSSMCLTRSASFIPTSLPAFTNNLKVFALK